MVSWLFWVQSESQDRELSKRQVSPPNMSQPFNKPTLTPQFCFNETALRDFLRLSRGTIDDSIIQNLNALLTPAREGFDPSSTAERQVEPARRRLIASGACQGFKENVLFQSWQARSDVLNYCAGVALDPTDSDLVLREAESATDRERVVDERLDPYSGRFFPREARTESLANLIRNERGVEGIIRARTWGLVTERCGDVGVRWEEALNRWRESTEGR
ncbi:MAG: hypothetical protein Q9226_003567 [Calogaya cf. arnoldii]